MKARAVFRAIRQGVSADLLRGKLQPVQHRRVARAHPQRDLLAFEFPQVGGIPESTIFPGLRQMDVHRAQQLSLRVFDGQLFESGLRAVGIGLERQLEKATRHPHPAHALDRHNHRRGGQRDLSPVIRQLNVVHIEVPPAVARLIHNHQPRLVAEEFGDIPRRRRQPFTAA